MARGRSTPYPAQLERFLAGLDGSQQTFSAATLEGVLTHPQHQKRGSTLGGIHKALMKAFADGKVIAFHDADGHPLREPDVIVLGSKAIGQPQVFGALGTPSPDPHFRPVTYEETIRRGSDVVDGEPEPAPAPADGVVAGAAEPPAELQSGGSEPAAERGEPTGRELTAEQAGVLYADYNDRPPASAPDWVPMSALRGRARRSAGSARGDHRRARGSQGRARGSAGGGCARRRTGGGAGGGAAQPRRAALRGTVDRERAAAA
ncbi:MAG: hypothetical protein ACRDLF_16180 [Solirubrobacteraceae bacterium]